MEILIKYNNFMKFLGPFVLFWVPLRANLLMTWSGLLTFPFLVFCAIAIFATCNTQCELNNVTKARCQVITFYGTSFLWWHSYNIRVFLEILWYLIHFSWPDILAFEIIQALFQHFNWSTLVCSKILKIYLYHVLYWSKKVKIKVSEIH